MIDLSKIEYRLVLIDENENQYNIKDYISNLSWEENEKELAVRISFSTRNARCSEKLLSDIAKIGRIVGVFATDNVKINEEVARGTIVDWIPSYTSSEEILQCKCYDELYNLQQSEDDIFFAEGTGTKTIITGICTNWKLPLDKYEGPNISHAKLMERSKKISSIILDVLKEAKDKGAEECVLRAEKGKINIIPIGSNKTVWCFQIDNVISVRHKISTSGMVTRVKVIGQENDEGKSSVEAVIDGKTEYGIRQEIHVKSKDDSLEAATSEAQRIIDEKGILQEEITIQSPDIPFLRKMDLVYVRAVTMDSYYYVLSVMHDADRGKMTLDLRKAVTKSITEPQKKDYNVGDIVDFHGGTHYVSSYPGSRGYPVNAGKAKITIKNGSGKAHPWHLVTENWGQSHVYGWVDDGTFD